MRSYRILTALMLVAFLGGWFVRAAAGPQPWGDVVVTLAAAAAILWASNRPEGA